MPWETDSGLKDDYYLRVDAAFFEENEKMGHQLCLHLGGTDLDDPEGDINDQQYPCGPGWESDDGSEATHFKSKTKFNRNTKMGLFVDRVAEVLDESQLATLGEPTSATTFVNMVFHMVADYKDYAAFKDRDGNDRPAGQTRTSLPTEIWMSEDDYNKSASKVDSKPAVADNKPSGESAADKAKKALAVKKAASSASASAPVANDITATLVALAQKHPQDEFAERALDLEAVAADDDLVQAVMDDTANGFWAKNQK